MAPEALAGRAAATARTRICDDATVATTPSTGGEVDARSGCSLTRGGATAGRCGRPGSPLDLAEPRIHATIQGPFADAAAASSSAICSSSSIYRCPVRRASRADALLPFPCAPRPPDVNIAWTSPHRDHAQTRIESSRAFPLRTKSWGGRRGLASRFTS